MPQLIGPNDIPTSEGAMLCGQNLHSLTCALALKSPCTSLIAKFLLKLHASACRGSSFSDNISEIEDGHSGPEEET
jgi:hypothetical protein